MRRRRCRAPCPGPQDHTGGARGDAEGAAAVPSRGPCGGYTLVELLVALIVGTLVALGIVQALRANANLAAVLGARQEARQNARAALELIAGELRGVPPAAIREMRENAIRFRLPRAWGVVCGVGSAVWVAFDAVALPMESFFARPHRGIAVEEGDAFRFVAAPDSSAAADPCSGMGGARRGFVVPAGADSAGVTAMLFEEVAYDVAASPSDPAGGFWLRRMSGYSAPDRPNMQPLAGPVPDSAALRFTYLRADGVTPAASPGEARLIGISVAMRGRGSSLVDTASTVVYLRNGKR